MNVKRIEIDLLPSELKPRKKMILPSMPIIPIAFGALGVLVAFYLALLGFAFYGSSQLASLNQQWEELEPAYRGYLGMQLEVQNLERAIQSASTIRDSGYSWAKKMNRISDLIAPEIWLTRLTLMQSPSKPFLELAGAVQTPKRSLSMGSITGLVDTLKNDADFMEGFSKLELGPVENDPNSVEEVLHFTIRIQLEKT